MFKLLSWDWGTKPGASLSALSIHSKEFKLGSGNVGVVSIQILVKAFYFFLSLFALPFSDEFRYLNK